MNFFMDGDQIDWAGVGVAIGVTITGVFGYLNRRNTSRIRVSTDEINDAVNHRHERSPDGLKLYDMTFELFKKVKDLSEWKTQVERRDRTQAVVLADQSGTLSSIKERLDTIEDVIGQIKTNCILHERKENEEQ